MKKVTVELIIDEDDEGLVADGVSAILTEQMQAVCPNSCLVDWQYAGRQFNATDVSRYEWDGKPIC